MLSNNINLEPVIITNAENDGSIKLNITNEKSDIIPLDIKLSGLSYQPGSVMSYELKLLDSSENCFIYPSSGIIPNDRNNFNLRATFIFCDNKECPEIT